ncbi:divergent protein kinase domain 1C-like isoform X2 [Dreissena polymorpha]|uniref:divergent protein kinase domain 1C-like isoform X2 n=1 Tax=Dreissena polymorpha TaxID=45954 RepID=UPI0022647FF3|nr:divergent protein kinase domain 1C-like isoform X2 [Dreissena polymorpha]
MCQLYHRGEVAGSFCPILCDTQLLQYRSCLNYKGGKYALQMVCKNCGASMYPPAVNSVKIQSLMLKGANSAGDVKLVFKMKDKLEETKQSLTGMFHDHLEIETYINRTRESVRNSYRNNLMVDMSHVHDIILYTWGYDLSEYLSQSQSHPSQVTSLKGAIYSILSLIEQQEYLLSKLLQNYTFLPQIFGTCGPAYGVEFTETLKKFEQPFSIGTGIDWNERALIAIKLIDLVKLMDEGLHETLHMCDVKPNNFGLRPNGDVTIIDSDCALFESDLRRQFGYSNCSSDQECAFFDCLGTCNIVLGKCYMDRANTNLQTICKDVFRGYSSAFTTGILHSPPSHIQPELSSLLDKCSLPESVRSQDGQPGKDIENLGLDIQTLLQSSIKPHRT